MHRAGASSAARDGGHGPLGSCDGGAVVTFGYSEHRLEFAPEGGPCVLCDPPRTPPPAANDTAAAAPRPSLSDCVRHAMGYHCRRWDLRCVARVIGADPDTAAWTDVRDDLLHALRGIDGWRLVRMLADCAARMERGHVSGAAELLAEWAELTVDAWADEQRESIAQDGRV